MASYFTQTVNKAVNAELHKSVYRPGLIRVPKSKQNCLAPVKQTMPEEESPDISVLGILR